MGDNGPQLSLPRPHTSHNSRQIDLVITGGGAVSSDWIAACTDHYWAPTFSSAIALPPCCCLSSDNPGFVRPSVPVLVWRV